MDGTSDPDRQKYANPMTGSDAVPHFLRRPWMRRLWIVRHQFWEFCQWIGVRQRLKCPRCGAIGTWKPYGGWLCWVDQRPIRRWLCKFCGYYMGLDGIMQAETGEKVWELTPKGVDEAETPRKWLKGKANPWAG